MSANITAGFKLVHAVQEGFSSKKIKTKDSPKHFIKIAPYRDEFSKTSLSEEDILQHH